MVRRGMIEAVGPAKDVTVPYDAETIDGKGLVVYPGFIDLYTTIGQRAGVERSATGKGRPVDLAEAPLISTPPDNRKGLTPEFDVAECARVDRRAGRTPAPAGFHRLAVGPVGCDRDRPERAGEPERLASPRSDRGRAGRAACAPGAPLRAGDGGLDRRHQPGSRPDSRPRPMAGDEASVVRKGPAKTRIPAS